MQALGHIRYPNSVQALSGPVQLLPDRAWMRSRRSRVLPASAIPTSASVFRQRLTNTNADMRRLAVEGLARAGDRDVLTELQQLGQTERSGGVLLALHYAQHQARRSRQQSAAACRRAEQCVSAAARPQIPARSRAIDGDRAGGIPTRSEPGRAAPRRGCHRFLA